MTFFSTPKLIIGISSINFPVLNSMLLIRSPQPSPSSAGRLALTLNRLPVPVHCIQWYLFEWTHCVVRLSPVAGGALFGAAQLCLYAENVRSANQANHDPE